MRGGYIIVDLKGAALSDSAVTISNVYESIEGNYYKPILLSGINIGGTERADIYTYATVNSGNYVLPVYGGTLTITADNAVTYTA